MPILATSHAQPERTSDARLARCKRRSISAGRPPFEVVAPDRQRLPLRASIRRTAAAAIRRDFLAASRLERAGDPPLRGQLRRRAVRAGRRARRAAPQGQFPARLARREPRALRARPEDVRRHACRPTPTSARCASPAGSARSRASSRRARRSTPARCQVEEALARIDAVYKPYHRALGELLVDTRRSFGVAVLIDCHSMPSTVRGGHGRLRPDIVLGDRYGTSCAQRADRARRPDPRPASAIRSAATSPMPAASSPSITASPAAASTPCRSRSTAASTWTSARSSGATASLACARDLARLRRRAVGRPSTAASLGAARRGRIGPKRKRAARLPRRPKSREETPKEGSAISLPHRNKLALHRTKIKSVDRIVPSTRNVAGLRNGSETVSVTM